MDRLDVRRQPFLSPQLLSPGEKGEARYLDGEWCACLLCAALVPRVPCQDRGHPSPLSRLNGRLVGKAGAPSGEAGQDLEQSTLS